MNLLIYLPTWDGRIPIPTIFKPTPMWSDPDEEGEVISLGNTQVVVEFGNLLMGLICKKSLGASSGSLLHICFIELGFEIAGHFYANILNALLLSEGHTIGLAETIADPDTYFEIESVIQNAKIKVEQVISGAHHMKLEEGLAKLFARHSRIRIQQLEDNGSRRFERFEY